jgi:hypothetical protein
VPYHSKCLSWRPVVASHELAFVLEHQKTMFYQIHDHTSDYKHVVNPSPLGAGGLLLSEPRPGA